MSTNAQLNAVIRTLTNLVRSAYLKRALTSADSEPRLNFWRVIYGNLLDITVLEWCKLFGADAEDHNQVHWKIVFPDEAVFRDGLLKYLGVDRDSWDAYWHQMKKYRDQQVAHLDFGKRDVSHYPVLDLAIASSCFYYDQVLTELRARGLAQEYPNDLKVYGDEFYSQAIRIARKVVGATTEFPEDSK
jgi:hypothetical protein